MYGSQRARKDTAREAQGHSRESVLQCKAIQRADAEGKPETRRHQYTGGSQKAALHEKTVSESKLSIRAFCDSDGRSSEDTFILRDLRKAYSSGIHEKRHKQLVRDGSKEFHHGRRKKA